MKFDLCKVGVSNFKSNIQSHHIQISCKIFLFRNQVPLMSGSLIGHSKVRDKHELNSKMNSFQPEKANA